MATIRGYHQSRPAGGSSGARFAVYDDYRTLLADPRIRVERAARHTTRKAIPRDCRHNDRIHDMCSPRTAGGQGLHQSSGEAEVRTCEEAGPALAVNQNMRHRDCRIREGLQDVASRYLNARTSQYGHAGDPPLDALAKQLKGHAQISAIPLGHLPAYWFHLSPPSHACCQHCTRTREARLASFRTRTGFCLYIFDRALCAQASSDNGLDGAALEDALRKRAHFKYGWRRCGRNRSVGRRRGRPRPPNYPQPARR